MSRNWKIVKQTEKVGREERQVDVKHVRYFPLESGGVVEGFGKLGFVCLRVIVRNDKGDELKLTLHTAGGNHQFPGFTITHQDTIGKPMIWIGEGKRRRQIPDALAKDVVIKGPKEKFRETDDFIKRIAITVGVELTETIMQKFAERYCEVAVRNMGAIA
jgi:hypothetical protein